MILSEVGIASHSRWRELSQHLPWFGLLAALSAVVLLPTMPIYRDIYGGDTGVFLYIGERILRGTIPYRDVWDHKAPLIYYINALALLIGRGSIWGLWVVELVSLCCTAWIGFVLMKRAFGAVAARFSSVLWLVSLALILIGGNYTEEFALPWQFLALYLLWHSDRAKRPAWHALLIGVTMAMALLLRPNLVGVQITIAVVITLRLAWVRQWRRLCLALGAIGVGALIVLLPVGAYFLAQGALDDLLDQVFHYSAVYSITTIGNRLQALLIGLGVLSLSGMSVITLFAWLGETMALRRGGQSAWPRNILVYVALIDLPVEIGLSVLSGRVYGHYYVSWLPACAVLVCCFACFFLETSKPYCDPEQANRGLAVLALLLSIAPLFQIASDINTPKDVANSRYQLVEYISRNTNPTDDVLVWGAETAVNFVARRESPTRFVYQYPLYVRGYQRPEMVQEFLRDLRANSPTLIVDTATTNDHVPPLDGTLRQHWAFSDDAYALLPEMDGVLSYIEVNYVRLATVGRERWAVYRYAGGHPIAGCFACDLMGK